MIEVKAVSVQEKEYFQNYNELFDHIVEVENLRMLQLEPDFKTMQWSFTTYVPQHVAVLYAHLKAQNDVVREAFENQLPLIEICTGDFTNPQYVVKTPNLDIEYLKKKWVLAYCTAHDMTVASN
jgi:hypothetical protein